MASSETSVPTTVEVEDEGRERLLSKKQQKKALKEERIKAQKLERRAREKAARKEKRKREREAAAAAASAITALDVGSSTSSTIKSTEDHGLDGQRKRGTHLSDDEGEKNDAERREHKRVKAEGEKLEPFGARIIVDLAFDALMSEKVSACRIRGSGLRIPRLIPGIRRVPISRFLHPSRVDRRDISDISHLNMRTGSHIPLFAISLHVQRQSKGRHAIQIPTVYVSRW